MGIDAPVTEDIVVYADLRWQAGTGIGRVQSALLSRTPPRLKLVDLAVPGRIGSPTSPLRIGRAIAAHGARKGIFWSPGYMPPAGSRTPAVVTVHDLTHLHFYSAAHAIYYGLVMKRLYRRCEAVICVSEYTRAEFLEWSGMDPGRVFTVYNGVAATFRDVVRHAAVGFPYVFYPGNRRKYKNVRRLLDAYARSRLPREGIRLLLTGEPDASLSKRALQLGVDRMLVFAGTVSDERIVELYRGARIVAYVSLYEGFGLPIIEGMAAGVPVLTSNTSSMPEVAGTAALLVEPTSVEEIACGLERLTYDESLRLSLIGRGYARAVQFDWDKSAAQVWDVVTQVGSDHREREPR